MNYELGPVTVSSAEMNHAPENTVKAVCEMYGWAWASRLWQDWHRDEVENRIGAHNIHLHETSRRIRKWLDERRPHP